MLCIQGRRSNRLLIFATSGQLIEREYETRDDTMVAYVGLVREVAEFLRKFQASLIPKSKNDQEHAPSKLANSSMDRNPKEIQWETLF